MMDELGGVQVIREVVDEMYERVLSDDLISGHFVGVDTQHLKNMQFEFIASALGGPVRYSGAELQAAHANRGISAAHYSAFVGHLADVLETRSVPKSLIDRILGQLAMYRDRIVGSSNVDG